MMNEKDFERLEDLLDAKMEKLDKIKETVSEIKETVSEIKETVTDTRLAVEALTEWADNVTVLTPVKIPVRKPE